MARKPKIEPRRTVKVPMTSIYGGRLTIGSYDFEGTPDEIIATLVCLKANYPDKVLIISYESVPYEDAYEYVVYEQRDENDDEIAARLAKEESYRKAQDARDLAEYERLQSKFGN